ncbi:FAD/NAD(P)-binding protein [Lagierella sp.]|uniref:FAD/NAD(P)-binding protein n=1 Tax=Lagierella sp. TaxID=2849657 RepID=UPI002638FC9C|nr:FAD/NAD(P)-binding protein [Lagierella sp.]
MRKIAIVGMGTSGMAILAAYEKMFSPEELGKFQFDCYDKEESFGRGYPYREDSRDLILNLKTDKLSYDYEKVEDFKDWYDENDKEYPGYSPRAVFGQYTKDRMEETVKNTGANKIFSLVSRIDKLEDSWEVEDEKGDVRVYDEVHLCNGELGQKRIFDLKPSDKFIQDIYPVNEKLKDIQEDDKVVVVGAGLTAVDLVSHLLHTKNVKNVVMFSRTCVIPTVRVAPTQLKVTHLTMDLLKKELKENYNRVSFEWFDENFTKELEIHDINYEDFLKTHMQGGIEGLVYNIENPDDLARVQALLPPMNGIFNLVWDSMTLEDRKKFREKYHPFMCLNRSPLPMESGEMLIEAKEKGILEMPREVTEVKEAEGGFILVDEKGNRVNDQVYDYCLNATGLDTSLSRVEIRNPLLHSLIDKRYLMVDDYGAITVIPETMEAISPRYGTLNNFHVYGVLASGVQYRNNSTMMIQMTAHKVAKLKANK